MVFFDSTGARRWYVTLVAFFVLVGFLLLAFLSLSSLFFAPTEPLTSYESHSENPAYAKTIALTFDDGPDPVYTHQVLTLLEEENVPATFFLIGDRVVRYPEVAKSILDRGFEIGNHTFTHAESMANSEARLRAELVSTDRVIRDATGIHTRLFRPPFLEDVNVGEFDGGKLGGDEMRWAENAGFVVVGANLDTQDWNVQGFAPEIILERLYSRIDPSRPTVIIMHEHAGKGATIEALRTFIPEMKARGYTFVPVSEYFGLTRADVMPNSQELTLQDTLIVGVASFVVGGLSTFNTAILILSIIGLVRIMTLLITRRLLVPYIRRGMLPSLLESIVSIPTQFGILRAQWPGERLAPITVLIPAYNEAANIEATVLSVMSGRLVPAQVIAIDDGSTDMTLAILKRLEQDYPQLEVISRENSGSKAGALNSALPYVRHEIIVAIDADTIIDPDALGYLSAHFERADVGAVAGKVYPATMHSLYAQFQYLEYMQGQNIDKQVFSIGNSIGVVPGAIGAWRKSVLLSLGGYSTDTVVEDQDLTLALLAAGHRIEFEPRAIAFTETPATALAFFRQRSRWVFGTLQCVWKYRAWFFSRARPALGWIVLPNSLLFNVVIPALIPIVDGMLVLGIFGIIDLRTAIAPFLLYTALDLWYAIEGMANERHASPKLIALVVWQRFFYRYTIAAALYRSFIRAAFGNFVSWGTHARRGECHLMLGTMLQSREALTPSPIQLSDLEQPHTTAA